MLKLGKYVIIKKKILDGHDEAMKKLLDDREGREKLLEERNKKIKELEEKLKDSEELHAKYVKDQANKLKISRKKWLSGYPDEDFGAK